MNSLINNGDKECMMNTVYTSGYKDVNDNARLNQRLEVSKRCSEFQMKEIIRNERLYINGNRKYFGD